MRNRVIIERVQPEIDGGRFFIKRVVGEAVAVSADIFSDGHDAMRAAVLYKHENDPQWSEVMMESHPNDVWTAHFTVDKLGTFHYKVEAWVDHLLNWYQGFLKKHEAGQDMGVELMIGADLLKKTAPGYAKAKAAKLTSAAKVLADKKSPEAAVAEVLSAGFAQLVQAFPMRQLQTVYDNNLRVRTERSKALFSTWYEIFPRSASEEAGQHGTFKDCERLLPQIAGMGFDVLYFPPIHPIGKLNRKGRNNAVTAQPGEPGSPWAIGSDEGGHKDIHPELGTLADYQHLLKAAEQHGIEVAFDLAFQCAPDHPYIKAHPEWFVWRPDGTIMYAENPPKKYQDIVPINFETEDWEKLWAELKSVVMYWCEVGVRIFRVDNPHTKPFRFWEWLIAEVQKDYPDTIFLAEAFTRPKVMGQLAKGGYTQSYSYFTWRTTKKEMEEYLLTLSQTESREYFRPNFWPNTPDILAFQLMGGGSNIFTLRVLLAATLSSNYGLYGPAYEFMENTGADTGKEEYHDSEKYEVRHYDWSHRTCVTDAISRINRIRRENAALQTTWNIEFTLTDNEHLMSYIKTSEDGTNTIWCIANFDARNTQTGHIEVPRALRTPNGRVHLKITDLLTGESYIWFNDWNYVELNPNKWPMHVFRVELA